jgi:hypothetical protein
MREEQHPHEATPPESLLYLGYAGLLLIFAGCYLGGYWGDVFVQAGAAAITSGVVVFLLHLLAWLAQRKRR